MNYGKGTPIGFTEELKYSGGTPVRVIRFENRMDVLSSAIYNGGRVTTDSIIIMQVPKDYNCSDPWEDADRVVRTLDLPKDTIVLMTAAEVEYVFTVSSSEYQGRKAFAAVTAGLSNQVIAGDVLENWEERHKVSIKRSNKLYGERGAPDFHPGTINTVAIVDTPLSLAGKANAIIAATEAKSAAMHIMGYEETGTTSDAVAIVSPIGEETGYAGTGSYIGVPMCRAVREGVCKSLIIRDDFPEDMGDARRDKIRKQFGF